MFSREIFAKRLSDYRKTIGLTQSDLANMIGVGRTTVTLLERGERSPSVEVLYRLGEVFGISSDYLIGLDDLSRDKS